MATAIEDIVKNVGSQVQLGSPLGRALMRLAQAVAGLGGGNLGGDDAPAAGGCCLLHVPIANGQVSQFVPFPEGCVQPDTNYIVIGTMLGGNLQQFAIPAKATIGFQVAFAAPTAGGIVMDFKIERC
ncbi:MAG TPA: hypothetical protein VE967_19710 [Gemmatimonadaceae bacterium]|nr:hypothetical protein [Gemmatimonadaceae bacterium]